jgi:putative PIG3 family NAD(P)H quinone oxidoreductase
MRAIVAQGFGGPEVLGLGEVPDPEVGPGEVRIRAHATAVNRADVLQRRGLYPPPPGASPILGLECAGLIETVGPEVTRWRAGDRVCALLSGGGYAEKVVCPAGHLLPVPERLDLQAAGAVAEVWLTAFDNIVIQGRLAAGEWLLVHGGGGGVGTAAIQLAHRVGARVAVTVGSRAKADRCRAAGADAAIVYREQDFVAAMKEPTGGRGADVVLDIVGGSYLERNLQVLATDGRLVVIGLMGGLEGTLDMGALLRRRLTVQGTTLRARSIAYKTELVRRFEVEMLPGLADGTLRPIVDRVLPLEEAAEAHRLMEANAHFGKIVLSIE